MALRTRLSFVRAIIKSIFIAASWRFGPGAPPQKLFESLKMPELPHKDTLKLPSAKLFPVVGVGASAGGLDAFKRLLKAIPVDSGMAYILVQHLEPTHESILVDLLQKVTDIPIHEVTNNVKVEPVLQLSPRPPRNEKNIPIDVFSPPWRKFTKAMASASFYQARQPTAPLD
jgi:hypothetical protein